MEALKRNRSPNYPGVPLPDAVQRALKLYEKTTGQEVNSEIAAKACGFKGLSGPTRQLLSAMSKYGLVSSKRGKVSTTSRTRVLKYKGAESREGKAELQSAILEAPLFSDLWEKRRAPDEQLVFDLVELGFSDAGAKRAVQCFRESVDFADLGDDDSHSEPIEESGEVEGRGQPLEQGSPVMRSAPLPRQNAFSWPLSADLTVTVSFSNRPAPDDVDALCDYLEVMKRQLSRERSQAQE